MHITLSQTPTAPTGLSCGAGGSLGSVEPDLHTRPAPILDSVTQANWSGFLHVLDAVKPLQESHHNITRLCQ